MVLETKRFYRKHGAITEKSKSNPELSHQLKNAYCSGTSRIRSEFIQSCSFKFVHLEFAKSSAVRRLAHEILEFCIAEMRVNLQHPYSLAKYFDLRDLADSLMTAQKLALYDAKVLREQESLHQISANSCDITLSSRVF